MNAHMDVSLAELAQECRMSVTHFVRGFRRSTGMPPHRWLLARRVGKAKVLLTESSHTLAQIALALRLLQPVAFQRRLQEPHADEPRTLAPRLRHPDGSPLGIARRAFWSVFEIRFHFPEEAPVRPYFISFLLPNWERPGCALRHLGRVRRKTSAKPMKTPRPRGSEISPLDIDRLAGRDPAARIFPPTCDRIAAARVPARRGRVSKSR